MLAQRNGGITVLHCGLTSSWTSSWYQPPWCQPLPSPVWTHWVNTLQLLIQQCPSLRQAPLALTEDVERHSRCHTSPNIVAGFTVVLPVVLAANVPQGQHLLAGREHPILEPVVRRDGGVAAAHLTGEGHRVAHVDVLRGGADRHLGVLRAVCGEDRQMRQALMRLGRTHVLRFTRAAKRGGGKEAKLPHGQWWVPGRAVEPQLALQWRIWDQRWP